MPWGGGVLGVGRNSVQSLCDRFFINVACAVLSRLRLARFPCLPGHRMVLNMTHSTIFQDHDLRIFLNRTGGILELPEHYT